MDRTGRIVSPAGLLHEPVYTGTEKLYLPSFAFLIEHGSQRVLFDLGIRKDWENLPPGIVNICKQLGSEISIEKNVSEILTENGIDVDAGAIDTVIWSHPHFDHTGDLTTFPKSVELVVGQGFKDAFLPAYPENQDSHILARDFEGRKVTEIAFDQSSSLKIGRFTAVDFFGDGSFYLLDTPGHSIGHMCALARTTTSPPTFVLLGADASHHVGELRPSEYLPLPETLDPSPIPRMTMSHLCPGHLFMDIHKSANKPFFTITKPFNHDLEVANWSLDGLMEFDAADNVLVIIAHDPTVETTVDFFPNGTLNDWLRKDASNNSRWRFLSELEAAAQEVLLKDKL